MSYYIGNIFEDNYSDKIEIISEQFSEYIDSSIIPDKALSEDNKYFFVPTIDSDIENSEIFIVFNPNQSVYYLFHI
jgi:hypothetical protein